MKIKLTDVRLAFVNVFEPHPEYGKFGTRVLFPTGSKNEKIVADAIEEAGSKTFGTKWAALKKTLQAANKLILHDGDEQAEERSYYAGQVYVNANAKIRPEVRGRDGTPITKEDGILYPGCHADIWLDIYGFKGKQSLVCASLLGLQFRSDDTPFSGSRVTDSDFTPISDGADADDL